MKAILKLSMAVFCTATVLSACSGIGSGTTESADETTSPVRIINLQTEQIPQSVSYTADLIAWEEINYAPASPGRINSIEVEVGDRVKKGQVLVEMDKTQLQQALLQYQNALSEYLRIDTLHKLGSISEQQYDLAKTQYDVANTNVEYLQENTTLESPLNGIVTGKYYQSGELYSGSPNASTGKAAIVSLMQINPLKAEIDVAERYFPLVREGMTATISTDIYPEKTFSGKISLLHPTIDANTRTFRVEIRIDNPQEVLRPGMFSRVVIDLDEIEALVAPANAVLLQQGTNNRYVFINENGTAKKTNVAIGQRFDDKIEIASDELEVGAELIVTGHTDLDDGDKISVTR
jgi:RND family efflux transporter MFP subunit